MKTRGVEAGVLEEEGSQVEGETVGACWDDGDVGCMARAEEGASRGRDVALV